MVGGVLEAQLQEQDKDLAFMKLTFLWQREADDKQ